MTPAHLDNVALRTTDLWPAFHGKHVFIAGRGFYGSAFEAYFTHLRSRGIDVSVTAFSRRDNWHIEDYESYGEANLRADFVINAAGAASGGTIHDMRRVHGLGPIYLFDHMVIGGKGLQISTGAIDSDTPYARAKRLAELGISLLGRDIQIVRPFATVGPGMDLNAHFAISTFIRRELAGQYLEVRPSCHRSFCHITDLLVQMLYVLVLGDGHSYNVGSDSVISMADAARVISDDVRVVDSTFPSNAGSDWYVGRDLRALDQFNLGLDYTSEEAILDTVRSFMPRTDCP